MRARYVVGTWRLIITLLFGAGFCVAASAEITGTPVEALDVCHKNQIALLRAGLHGTPESFEVNRGAIEYAMAFGAPFETAYKRLNSHEVILDLGDGKGRFGREMTGVSELQGVAHFEPERISHRAVRTNFQRTYEFLKSVMLKPSDQRPQVVGFTYDEGIPHAMPSKGGRYVQMRGLFEELPDEMVPRGNLGVEFWGVLAYSDKVDVSARRAFRAFEKGSELFLEIDQSADWSNARTVITLPSGEMISLTDWLRTRTEGLAVESYYTQGLSDLHFITHVTITGEPKLPSLVLDTKRSKFNLRPPVRYFRETGLPR